MFDELDDPAPDLRPAQLLPHVQARGRVLRRRRRMAAAGGAGTTLALVAAVALALPTGERETDSLQFASPPPSAVETSTPSSSPTAAPTPTPTEPAPVEPTTIPVPPEPEPTEEPAETDPPVTAPPSEAPSAPSEPAGGGELVLGGIDLGVTQIGAAREQAVAAVTAVLGPPSEDPSSVTRCVTSMSEVAWPQFTLAFDEADRLSGWTTQSPSLRTPSGVAVGTTVARLREVYGERLRLYPPNPDHGDTYGIDDVSMVGALSGPGDTDRVQSLANGDCTGP